MDTTNLLHDEINDELVRLSDIEVGTDQYKSTVDGLTRLMDREIELKKLDLDAKDKYENRKRAEKEYELKLIQAKEEKKSRIIKNIIDVAGIILPIGLTVWGTLKTFQFEEEGTITSVIGRGFINKLHPKK